MAIQAIPLLAGALGRAVAVRAGAGIAGKAAGQFGASALANGMMNRGQGRPDTGVSQYARQNKGEIAMGAAFASMTSPGISKAGAAAFDSVISPQQFGHP